MSMKPQDVKNGPQRSRSFRRWNPQNLKLKLWKIQPWGTRRMNRPRGQKVYEHGSQKSMNLNVQNFWDGSFKNPMNLNPRNLWGYSPSNLQTFRLKKWIYACGFSNHQCGIEWSNIQLVHCFPHFICSSCSGSCSKQIHFFQVHAQNVGIKPMLSYYPCCHSISDHRKPTWSSKVKTRRRNNQSTEDNKR